MPLMLEEREERDDEGVRRRPGVAGAEDVWCALDCAMREPKRDVASRETVEVDRRGAAGGVYV